MTGDGWLGLRVLTSAFLQSPPSCTAKRSARADAGSPARRVLTDYELASRLSFFLWNTTPDPALLDAAESGALASSSGPRGAGRIACSPRRARREAIEELFADYLRLDALDSAGQAARGLPAGDAGAAGGDEAGDAALAAHAAVRARGRLPRHLHHHEDLRQRRARRSSTACARRPGTRSARSTLPADGPRAGLLTQASFLVGARASGPHVADHARQVHPREPAVPGRPGAAARRRHDAARHQRRAKTMREKLTRHREDAACAGCHNADGSARPRARALRRHRRVPHDRERRRDRRQRRARRRALRRRARARRGARREPGRQRVLRAHACCATRAARSKTRSEGEADHDACTRRSRRAGYRMPDADASRSRPTPRSAKWELCNEQAHAHEDGERSCAARSRPGCRSASDCRCSRRC